MAALLRLVPVLQSPVDPTAPVPLAAYGDVAGQLAAIGIEVSDADDAAGFARWRQATRVLHLPYMLSDYITDSDARAAWRTTFGIDPLAVAQGLMAGPSDQRITLLRGDFAAAEVVAAWTRSGYRERGAGTGVFGYGDDPDEGCLDLDAPVCNFGDLGAANNAAVLPDGTVVFASTGDLVQAVQAVAAGTAPSLAGRPDVAALLAAGLPALASAQLLPGTALHESDPLVSISARSANPNVPTQAVPAMQAAATQAAEQSAMPMVSVALVGFTPGGPLAPLDRAGTPEPLPGRPDARVEIALAFTTRADAAAAAPVVAARLATQVSLSLSRRPYAELFPDRAIRVADAQPVLLLDLGLGAGLAPDIGIVMAGVKDLYFVGW